jgi:hypothetical protein
LAQIFQFADIATTDAHTEDNRMANAKGKKKRQPALPAGPASNQGGSGAYLCLAQLKASLTPVSSKQPVVRSFRAKWTVPPAPRTISDQVLFLFIGMETAAGWPRAILQPVLQWGRAQGFGGAYWSLSTWYVRATAPQVLDVAARSASTTVEPETTLSARIDARRSDSGIFRYACTVEGIPEATLIIDRPEALVQCGIALEAPRLTDASQLPEVYATTFTEIAATDLGAGDLPLEWDINNASPALATIVPSDTANVLVLRYR